MDANYATSRLLLRILDENSASSVLTFYQSNREHLETWEPLRPSHFYSANYQLALLAAERNLLLRSKAIRYYLFDKTNPQKIIGTINFYHILRSPDNSCKLGYKLAESAMHQGFAYEALSFLIPKAFKDYPIFRIEADIMEQNVSSLRLIEKLNFTYEGITRSCFEVHGKREDHRRYSLLLTD